MATTCIDEPSFFTKAESQKCRVWEHITTPQQIEQIGWFEENTVQALQYLKPQFRKLVNTHLRREEEEEEEEEEID